ncbi:NAD(P)/FAD-dependent oxidoreductase [Natronolimnohabitans innermongolicus]|uniref:Thioredoxin reductase-like protein n=1 Tax=Natronolimnohabitans innermongolicus JCM 12255 TaxID=1227499 RepID=L9X588_9EURY|nr:NAD(P)/FAD-dependent oxidoreductase [Natronolimnohabitans innermongolicus]ELY56616.1 thioredoxin reductase-like protein [Natronolimnohabitans innermongolicus JCM 12255]
MTTTDTDTDSTPTATDASTATETSDETATDTPPAYDVAVVGGGPAGCSAAVFTARADLETILFEHDRASLLKSAHLENYLGFPFGIQPTQFLELAREHVREVGCTAHREGVETVRRAPSSGETDGDDGFVLETDARSVRAERVIVASWARTAFLEALDLTREPEEPGPVMVVPTDEDGRTDCDGVYAAGRITSQNHQAIVNAGNGADVALTLIRDVRPDYYNDWVVTEGYYESYDRSVPDGVEEISIAERKRRKARAETKMAAFFEPGENGSLERDGE